MPSTHAVRRSAARAAIVGITAGMAFAVATFVVASYQALRAAPAWHSALAPDSPLLIGVLAAGVSTVLLLRYLPGGLRSLLRGG